MTLYVYDSETGDLMARVHGDSNAACEARANEAYGSNDVEWSYSQRSPIECDDDADDLRA